MEEGTEGDVDRFPTPDELWEMTYPDPKEAVEMSQSLESKIY